MNNFSCYIYRSSNNIKKTITVNNSDYYSLSIFEIIWKLYKDEIIILIAFNI